MAAMQIGPNTKTKTTTSQEESSSQGNIFDVLVLPVCF
jgi:hypothetical protein